MISEDNRYVERLGSTIDTYPILKSVENPSREIANFLDNNNLPVLEIQLKPSTYRDHYINSIIMHKLTLYDSLGLHVQALYKKLLTDDTIIVNGEKIEIHYFKPMFYKQDMIFHVFVKSSSGMELLQFSTCRDEMKPPFLSTLNFYYMHMLKSPELKNLCGNQLDKQIFEIY